MYGMKLFSIINSAAVEVWEWIDNLNTQFNMHVITYPRWSKLKALTWNKSDRDGEGNDSIK